MTDSYVLKNIGQGIVSFDVMVPAGNLDGMPKHKMRKAVRSSIVKVSIPWGSTVDLVQVLGAPSDVVASLPEVVAIQKSVNVMLLTELKDMTARAKEQAEAARQAEAEAEEAARQAEVERQQQEQQEQLEREARAAQVQDTPLAEEEAEEEAEVESSEVEDEDKPAKKKPGRKKKK